MSNKLPVFAMSALVLLTQTACVTNSSPATCTVIGAKNFAKDASADQICDDFKARLSKVLSDVDSTYGTDGLTIALELNERGSVQARVTRETSDGPVVHPVIAVDVMDRALAQQDLDRLADAVAQQLMGK